MSSDLPAETSDSSYEIRPGDVASAMDHPSSRESRPSADSLRPIRLLTLKELFERPRSTWLVHRVFRRGELVEIHGQPNAGKTFFALDIALSVAAGARWCGRQVEQGLVIYVAAEGASGLAARILAWREPITDPDASPWRNVLILDEAVPLLCDGQRRLLAAITEVAATPVLIVVDTLARCMTGGDENTAKDMGQLIESCDEIRRVTGATVLLVHHSGKPHKGSPATERGSSALRGAVDTMIEVSLDRSGGRATVYAKCEKQKEAEAFSTLRFELQTVVTGEDADGSALTSCRLTYRPDGGSRSDRPDGMESADLQICRALRECFDNDGAPHGRLIKASSVPASTFDRRLQSLVKGGFIESRGSGKSKRYFLTGKFSDPLHPSHSLTPTDPHGSEGTSNTSSRPPKGGESESEGERKNQAELKAGVQAQVERLDSLSREGGPE